MKAPLIWTMNDFPTYEMICSWSMHGKLACLCCMGNNKTFTLTNSDKISFLLLPGILPINYKYKRNKHDFFIGRVERDIALLVPPTEKLCDVVS